jgi:ribosomal protein S18 acetylase RimI-like enzyme
MAVRVRAADRSDVPALGFGDDTLVEFLRHWVFLAAIGDAEVLVAESDGGDCTVVIGRVVIDLARGQVLALEVDARHRRTGVGRALMRAAQDVGSARGHRRLTLLVGVDNDGARAFYRALGWIDDGDEMSDGLTSGDGTVVQAPVMCRRLVLDLSPPRRRPVPPRPG